MNDNYIGSGQALICAFKKYGKQSFVRTILSLHETREAALGEERRLVDSEFIKLDSNYNLIEGGLQNPGEHIWRGPDVERIKKLLSKASTGYNNPDFVRRWLAVYESIAPMVCYYACCTDIPDRFITRIVHKRLGISVKLHRVLAYYAHCGYLNIDGEADWKDYYSKDPAGVEVAVKTVVSAIRPSIPREYKEYFPLKESYVSSIEELVTFLADLTISDSMLTNLTPDLVPTFGQGVGSRIDYFSYLGIISHVGECEIDIRQRLPNSRRKVGRKTLYSFQKGSYGPFIETDGGLNEYMLNFDGRSIQKVRLQLPDYGDWGTD